MHDSDRCIVRVKLGGNSVGTGFVIAPGKVLTCAHVITDGQGKKKGKKPLEIEFLTGEPLGRCQSVSLDPKYFSPENEHDIAVLTWEGELPRGVKPAVLSAKRSLAGVEVRTRGFPELGKYDSQPGVGRITDYMTRSGQQSDWSLSSDQITGGFSGAPLFESVGRLVVGMVCAVAPPDGNWRNTKTAFAVSCQTIRAVCGELIQAQDAAVEREHRQAIARLKKQVVKLLRGSREALKALAEALELSDEEPSTELAEIVAARLIGDSPSDSTSDPPSDPTVDAMTVSRIVDLLIPLYQELAGRSRLAAKCILDVYLAILSAILDPDLVKSLRSLAHHGERTFVIPVSSRTIVGILMAGLDGRWGEFHPPDKPGDDPRSKREIPLPPESGYSTPKRVKSLKNADGGLNHTAIFQTIEDGLGISLDHLNHDARLARLRSILHTSERLNDRVFVVSDHAQPADTKVWRHLRESFPYLHLIEMSKPGQADLQRDADAMAMLNICNFGRGKTTKSANVKSKSIKSAKPSRSTKSAKSTPRRSR